MPTPKITAETVLHVNGGGRYSTLVQKVLINGEETKITLGTHTDGSPDFNVTGRRLSYQPPGTWSDEDLETLDLLELGAKQEVINAWILERRPE